MAEHVIRGCEKPTHRPLPDPQVPTECSELIYYIPPRAYDNPMKAGPFVTTT